MMLTGGQSKFEFSSNSITTIIKIVTLRNDISKDGLRIKIIKLINNDLEP